MKRNPCRPPFIQCPGVLPLNQVLVHPIMRTSATYGPLFLAVIFKPCLCWTLSRCVKVVDGLLPVDHTKKPFQVLLDLHQAPFFSSGCGILFVTRHMNERCPVIMASAVCFPWWKWDYGLDRVRKFDHHYSCDARWDISIVRLQHQGTSDGNTSVCDLATCAMC